MNRKTYYAMMIFLSALSFSMLPSCSSGDENAGKGPGENLPSAWSSEKNVRWSYELAGRGWSSPVVYGNKV